jgi:DNA mismatch repair protein MutL
VRFADPEGVREQVRTAVEDALLREGLIRSSAPRGRSAVDETEIAPERGDAGDDGDAATDAPPSAPDPPPTDAGDPIGPDDIRGSGGGEPSRDTTDAGAEQASPTTTDTEAAADRPDGPTENKVEPPPENEAEPSPPGSDAEPTTAGADADSGTRSGTDPHDARRFRPGTEQARLATGVAADDGDPEERASFERLPALRVLGQLNETYVVAETDDGLVLIDQHAADERINYERLRERFTEDTTAQALADPVELSLTAREAALFDEYADALTRLGFRAERTDDRTVAVRTVPELIAEAAGPDLVRDVLSAFVTGEAAAAETVDAAADDLIADLACYPSITGNTSLTEGTVVDLLDRLDDCENPWACPHGRPVVIEFDREEIEARFERDYPGHGGHD